MIVNSRDGYGSEVGNKHLRKCGYFAIIFFCSYSISSIKHTINDVVGAPLK